ncbi:MAG: class I SAM-dependent methyltransferase [Acidobacteria bacterium]|nr:class I SAM-dependent methyltransferase [Acidobacteriota bacterium]
MTKLTRQQVLEIARKLYAGPPAVRNAIQRARPHICPFEDLAACVPEGAHVLDFGCGSGLFLAVLAATRPGFRGIGVDPSQAAIEAAHTMAVRLAARHATSQLSFARLESLATMPAGPFDLVSMIDVAHHLPAGQLEAHIAALAARVRPGGWFLYKDMASRPRWMAMLNRAHDLVVAREWIHYVQPDRVERQLAEAGWRLVRSEAWRLLWYSHDLRLFQRSSH